MVAEDFLRHLIFLQGGQYHGTRIDIYSAILRLEHG